MIKSEKINEIIEKYLFEPNNQETRDIIASQISDVYGYEIIDCTTSKEIDRQLLSFEGINPKTDKMITIKINTNSP